MPTIHQDKACYTVIVTVEADDAATLGLMREHASAGLDAFKAYEGYLAGALHQSVEAHRLVQYVQWRDEATYRACIEDPAWDRLPSAVLALSAVQRGLARMDVRAYEVVRSVDAGGV